MHTINANGVSISVSRGIVKFGYFYDEDWLEKKSLVDPEIIIQHLKDNKDKVDIFVFSQRLPDTVPKYPYYMEWDNVAVVPVIDYQEWWSKRLPQVTRKNVRRSKKRGVVVKVVDYDDEFVKGIVKIYNESPVRQGRAFWHYGKDFETVKRINSSYLKRSDFLGAYYKEELIGFLKLVYIENVARIMQIISMSKHNDKRTTNALIAKAVEVCDERDMDYLIYGKYIYGKNTRSSVIEFKRRNGFEMVEFPTYYVPLNVKGGVVLKLKLHHGIIGLMPDKTYWLMQQVRAKWYGKVLKSIYCDDTKVSD